MLACLLGSSVTAAGELGDGRVGGNQRHDCRGSTGEKDQLHVESILFKNARVFGDPGRQRVAADRAVADVYPGQLCQDGIIPKDQ